MASKYRTNSISSPTSLRRNSRSTGNSHRKALQQELREVTGVKSRFDYVRFTVGTILLLVAAFLTLAMVSNLFTGVEDQAGVQAGHIVRAANYAGSLGALCSYYLMNNLFGVMSLLIPIFLFAIALKLFLRDAGNIRLWLLFVHLSIIMVVGSVDMALLQNFLPDTLRNNLAFEMGGMHGKTVFSQMQDYIGMPPATVILALVTLAYVGYWFTQILVIFFRGLARIGHWLAGTSQKITPENETSESDDHSTSEDTPLSDGTGEDIAPRTVQDADEETVPCSVEENISYPAAEEEEVRVIHLDLESHPVENATAALPTAEKSTEKDGGSESENNEVLSSDIEEQLELRLTDTHKEDVAHAKTVADVEALGPYDPKADLSRYHYPPLSLLARHDAGNAPIDMEEQNANKNRIIQVLGNFDVRISHISATVGPTVTLYEIKPAKGIRIAKIRNLEDDIALSLAAIGIRIIAPIPGKDTIGIEVPNKKPQIVSMESILNTQKFRDTDYALPIALGKTITNEIFMVDLAKMPHLLVAGATGQGKSVGLNAIITSLLYKKHPAELKLVMIDPKKVEFSMYNPILKHFLAQVPDSDEPVITDVKKVVQTLKSLCQEMDDRYDLLKKARCKNIKEYNAKFISRRLNPDDGHRFLPYIVVIIDEFGDLIMTAGKDIELPIARIAQLARAVGMHMVIATQSPRTTIITGKIKANFPARMAFKVSGRVESMTILDRTGANNLIGRGDMLFMAGSDVTRVQCAFVDTPEIEAITDYISHQQSYPAAYELPLVAEEGNEGGESYTNVGSTFEQVAHFVVSTGQGSTSKIQRTFSIGFNRAGRLMDQLEEAGIVGPVNGSKPREVYVQSEIELQQILEQLRVQGKKFD